jgi:hypothetical protein
MKLRSGALPVEHQGWGVNAHRVGRVETRLRALKMERPYNETSFWCAARQSPLL